MDKKELHKKSKIRKMTEDLLNINDCSSKKRKQASSVHEEFRIPKKIRLKPDPTQLFSQSKPKHNQFEEKIKDKLQGIEKSSSSSLSVVKEARRIGIIKSWTPPLKNLVPQPIRQKEGNNSQNTVLINDDDYDGGQKNVPKFNVSCDSSSRAIADQEFECKSESEKSFKNNMKCDSSIRISGAEVSSTPKLVPIEERISLSEKKSLDVDNCASNDSVNHIKGEISLAEPIEKKLNLQKHEYQLASREDKRKPYHTHTPSADISKEDSGMVTLLEEIDLTEGRDEQLIGIKCSNEEESIEVARDETDSKYDLVDDKILRKEGLSESSLTSQNAPKSDNFEKSKRIQDIDPAEPSSRLEKHSQFEKRKDDDQIKTSEESFGRCPSPELIDLTDDSREILSNSEFIISNDTTKITTAHDNNFNEENLDRNNNNNNDCQPFCSRDLRYTETVIENLKTPVVCKIFRKGCLDSDVIKFIGSDSNKNVNGCDVSSAHSCGQTQTFSSKSIVSDEQDRNNKIETDVVSQQEEEAERKIMKEIQIYLYDSLDLDKGQKEEQSDDIQCQDNSIVTNNENSRDQSEHSQNCNEVLVIDEFENEVQENDQSCIHEENLLGHQQKENEGHVSKIYEGCENEPRYDKQQEDCEQNKGVESNEFKEFQNGDVDILGKNLVHEDDYHNIPENDEQIESKVVCEKEDQLGNNQIELLNEDDDAFDELIDMSCTQLIHIEKEYSNKNEVVKDQSSSGSIQQDKNKGIVSCTGKVRIPWVVKESEKNERNEDASHPQIQWIDKMSEEKQKLRAVIQELAKLNATILQVRQKIWPKMMKPDK